MSMMVRRIMVIFAGCAFTLMTLADTPSIVNVTARQRHPWNGIVDISYEVVGNVTAGLPTGSEAFLLVTATNRTDGTCYEASVAALSGDTGDAEGVHHVIWDVTAQRLEFKSSNIVFAVAYIPLPLYCVIDLSAGANAANYPVSYLHDVPAGGWTDEYKTTKLVLRRISPGTFIMGSNQTDESHRVTLTKPFFCGIFEITQKQYELVMGSNPAAYTDDVRPVEQVSYNMIRDSAQWPTSSAVGANSFMGKLRTRTGLDFDLPTEAQWEYSCRAGTTTTYSYGNSADGDYMWYSSNSSSTTHAVGSKNPNAWGLYDMHGNVCEYCLDWYGELPNDQTDPLGPFSGSKRVRRGGGWKFNADDCTSYSRGNGTPSEKYSDWGFRLVRTLSSNDDEQNSEELVWAKQSGAILCDGESSSTSVSISSSWRPNSPMNFSDGLVAYYVFNGDANDYSGNENNGIINGVTPTTDRYGTASSAYHFDGTSAYIEVPDSDSLRQVGQTVTLSAWVKPEVWDGDWISVLCKGYGETSRQYGIAFSKNNFWLFNYHTGSIENDVPTSRGNILGNWNHVVMSYSPQSITAYLNGENIGAMTPVGNMIENSDALYIGIDPPGATEHLKGDIDEVRVYNRTLSTAEVRALSNGDNPTATVVGEGTHVYRYDVGDSIGIVQAGIGAFDSSLNIPSTIDNKPVVSIGRYAFTDCCDIETVTIPASVTEIGDYAFAGCSNLSQVTLSGSIGTLTVGGNAFDTTATVVIEQMEGLYFGGWTNANGVIISDPFHSPVAVTVSPRWMNDGREYDEHIIFFEDFERDSMEFELVTVGTFPHPACSQDGKGGNGSRGFGFGRSSATGNAHLNYVNTLMASFKAKYFITRVEFYEMERYGNWGSCGSIIINRRGDEQVENNDFCKMPVNDKVADKEYRRRDIEIGMMATNISFQVSDITDVSEEFIDNVKIYGRLARPCVVTFDANGGTGEMVTQTVIEGDMLVLGSNVFARTGYYFRGWSTTADGDVVYADGATILDIPANMDGTTFYAVWKPYTPKITPAEDTAFIQVSETVAVSHDADANDIIILYTVDGSDPKEHGHECKGEFSIYESCTIRVVAYGAGRYSDEDCITLTRTEGLSEAANLYGYLMETDTGNPWTVVTDVSHDGVSCVRSGVIGHGGMTWLQTSIRNVGTISFWWKAACEVAEEEDGETYWHDYGSFFVDGVEKAKIAGNDTGWCKVEVDVPTGGKHVLRWEYRKDGATSYSPDCIWLDQVQWIPADGSGYTLTTPEPVPYSWLTGYNLGLDSDFETAAKQATGKVDAKGRAMAVWQDYVAGTDPTNQNDLLRAVIAMSNDVPIVTWTPNLNTNGEVRVYTVLGKTNLMDAAWVCPTNATHRFFKVKVEMP